MTTRTYEIVEKDKETQYSILSGFVKTPTKGVVYLLMMQGVPMSVDETTDFLKLGSRFHIRDFNKAFLELETDGLIKVVDDGAGPEVD